MTLGAVADTGPLIHLAEIDALSLCGEFDPLVIPETVYDELDDGGVPDSFSSLSTERVTAPPVGQFDQLDPGERAAIRVAVERDTTLLTDDLATRNAATDRNVDVHGSVGVIALAHERDRLDTDTASTLMRSLQRETSLFVTEAVIQRGIDRLNGGS